MWFSEETVVTERIKAVKRVKNENENHGKLKVIENL